MEKLKEKTEIAIDQRQVIIHVHYDLFFLARRFLIGKPEVGNTAAFSFFMASS